MANFQATLFVVTGVATLAAGYVELVRAAKKITSAINGPSNNNPNA
jgi:hypothetical protein